MSNTETLLSRFDKLSEDEQQILLALAILFAPLGQTRLQEILRVLKCVEPKVYKQIAKPLREKLVRQGLIEVTQHGWRCVTGGISEVLMRIAFQQYPELFAKLAKFSLANREYVPKHLQLIDKVRRLRFFLYLGDDKHFEVSYQGVESEFPRESMSALVLLFFQPWLMNFIGRMGVVVMNPQEEGAFTRQILLHFQSRLMNLVRVTESQGDKFVEALRHAGLGCDVTIA